MLQKIGRIIGVVRWGESEAFDWQKFPSMPMGHSAENQLPLIITLTKIA